jgi:Protein of unknown function (DUF3102)
MAENAHARAADPGAAALCLDESSNANNSVTITSGQALAAEIEAAHQAATGAARSAVEHAIECGRLLIQAKASVAHGEWLPWIEANLTFGPRQAQKYMRLADRAEALPNAHPDAHLTIDGAMALLAGSRDRSIFDELVDLGCHFTPTSLMLPDDLPLEDFGKIGELLATIERGTPALQEWLYVQAKVQGYGDALLAEVARLEPLQAAIVEAVTAGRGWPENAEAVYARTCEWIARAETWRRECLRVDLAAANARLAEAVGGKLMVQRRAVRLCKGGAP